ncbi:MAG: pyridoxal-phosphate dependent enzyme [Chloroflexi bacterium]|nr:pyridoxal-phosphate dependent enzyme [Chloroflexota bacterium]
MTRQTQAAITRETLARSLEKLPRFALGVFPTPLEDCPRLARALGVRRFLMKRDDLSGLAFGGNKIRHLEFRMGQLLQRGYDAFINRDLPVSNNARINAAASVKAGIRYIQVCPKWPRQEIQGNLLLQDLMGIEVHQLDTTDGKEADQYCLDLGNRLRQEGYKPYVRPEDPTLVSLSAIFGYLDCALELDWQLCRLGIEAPKIYMVAGSSVTGLTLAACLLALDWRVTGISPYAWVKQTALSDLSARSKEAAEFLGLPHGLEPHDLDISVDYCGPGYGVLTPEASDAVRLVAREEAIFLDPIYNAKAMAGLIDHARRGIVGQGDTVIYVHSGGTPNIFTYADELKTR